MWPSACNSLNRGREHGESQSVRIRYFIWCLAAVALLFCLGSLHVFASGLDQLARDMKLDSAPEASLVYDRHNNLVFSFASEDRTNVPLDRVSSTMVSALLTAEDRYFFQHAGMDIIGLARAAWVDLKARSVKQGGSTITQQLIRQVALTTDRNLQRKIKEALLALRVERRFDKNTILEAYLNRIYLGSGHYGVEAAARGYFAKPASELDSAESALLAGIIPLPFGLFAANVAEHRQIAARYGVESDARERFHHRERIHRGDCLADRARPGTPRSLHDHASRERSARL